ncbi:MULTISPECIES: AzlC family ABC transporter permease [Streptococcus]|uniref:Branched-chain amino acid ABC transporter permease n=1 Tax=Streptococcus periodonticum TaxID=2490633 RepID=A0A3S9MT88_9STRE|nr:MULTISPECIES: AzlC family ABC transporter permease [Streptococcus]AZQ42391.1 branched-chain amino acid ABC transporter permease [Streptococcus periodonticum]
MIGKSFKDGAKAAMPTALGYISIGLACGIIGASYVSPLEMALMSSLVYAGSAQFAMLALLAIHAPVTAIALTVFLINLRLFLLSLHTSTFFRHASLLQNIGIGILLTDETYGVLLSERVHTKDISLQWMYGNNITSYLAWIVGSVVGTTLGSLLPNPEMFGLDFALVGMFIGIFSSQFLVMLHKTKLQKLLVILVVVTLSFFALIMVISSSLAVLFSTLLSCAVGVILDDK